MKQIFTMLIALLIALPSIGMQTHNSRKIAGRSHRTTGEIRNRQDKTGSSSLHRMCLPLYTSLKTPGQKNAAILMQQLDNIHYLVYDPDLSQWYDYSLDEYTYDAAGRNTAWTENYRNEETGEFEPGSNWAYTYDNNNMVEVVMSYWDSDISQWMPDYKTSYDYNPDGTIALEQEYTRDGENWLLMSKTEYSYNAGGNPILEITYYWNPDTSEWIQTYQTENTYNPDNSIATSTFYYRDEINNVWSPNYREEYTYDSGGYLLYYIELFWDNTGNAWMNDYKDEYIYDGNQNITVMLESEWDGNL